MIRIDPHSDHVLSIKKQTDVFLALRKIIKINEKEEIMES